MVQWTTSNWCTLHQTADGDELMCTAVDGAVDDDEKCTTRDGAVDDAELVYVDELVNAAPDGAEDIVEQFINVERLR